MSFENYLEEEIKAFLKTHRFSLGYAYSKIKEIPRLKVHVLMYLAVTNVPLTISLSDKKEVETIKQNMLRPDTLPTEYRKLWDCYQYYSRERESDIELLNRLKTAVYEQLQYTGYTQEQLPGLIGKSRNEEEFSIHDYSVALCKLKHMR